MWREQPPAQSRGVWLLRQLTVGSGLQNYRKADLSIDSSDALCGHARTSLIFHLTRTNKEACDHLQESLDMLQGHQAAYQTSVSRCLDKLSHDTRTPTQVLQAKSMAMLCTKALQGTQKRGIFYRGACLQEHNCCQGKKCAHHHMTFVTSAALNFFSPVQCGETLRGDSPPGNFIGWCFEICLAVITKRGQSHPTPTRSVLQRTPLNSHFRNGSDKRAVPITFTNKVYNFVGDFLDRVSIIPYVFSRLEK